jgi:hypothetical protein
MPVICKKKAGAVSYFNLRAHDPRQESDLQLGSNSRHTHITYSMYTGARINASDGVFICGARLIELSSQIIGSRRAISGKRDRPRAPMHAAALCVAPAASRECGMPRRRHISPPPLAHLTGRRVTKIRRTLCVSDESGRLYANEKLERERTCSRGFGEKNFDTA